jgi:hypothetical protein
VSVDARGPVDGPELASAASAGPGLPSPHAPRSREALCSHYTRGLAGAATCPAAVAWCVSRAHLSGGYGILSLSSQHRQANATGRVSGGICISTARRYRYWLHHRLRRSPERERTIARSRHQPRSHEVLSVNGRGTSQLTPSPVNENRRLGEHLRLRMSLSSKANLSQATRRFGRRNPATSTRAPASALGGGPPTHGQPG